MTCQAEAEHIGKSRQIDTSECIRIMVRGKISRAAAAAAGILAMAGCEASSLGVEAGPSALNRT